MLSRAGDRQLAWRTQLFTVKVFDRQLFHLTTDNFAYQYIRISISHRGMLALINDEKKFKVIYRVECFANIKCNGKNGTVLSFILK